MKLALSHSLNFKSHTSNTRKTNQGLAIAYQWSLQQKSPLVNSDSPFSTPMLGKEETMPFHSPSNIEEKTDWSHPKNPLRRSMKSCTKFPLNCCSGFWLVQTLCSRIRTCEILPTLRSLDQTLKPPMLLGADGWLRFVILMKKWNRCTDGSPQEKEDLKSNIHGTITLVAEGFIFIPILFPHTKNATSLMAPSFF